MTAPRLPLKTLARIPRASRLTAYAGAAVRPEMRTVKRREHGLGIEVYALSSDAECRKMRAPKADFDPLNVFSPHLMTETPQIHVVGQRSGGTAA